MIPSETVGIQYKAAEPTNLDYRSTALNAAVQLGQGKASREWTLDVARDFEDYLRNGAAA